MTSLAFMECCQRLSVTPKTLRQWLAQAEIALHPHPTDARITCLTSDQLQLLAALHGRVLHPSGNPLVGDRLESGETTDADLRTRLAQLEAQVATLQTQVTDLAFQLLREREQRAEQRLQALEAQISQVQDEAVAPFVGPAPCVPEQPEMSSFACHPTEKRAPLIPLIEYGARGRYVHYSRTCGEREHAFDRDRRKKLACVDVCLKRGRGSLQVGDRQALGHAKTSACRYGGEHYEKLTSSVFVGLVCIRDAR